jgi:hypothetical protein
MLRHEQEARGVESRLAAEEGEMESVGSVSHQEVGYEGTWDEETAGIEHGSYRRTSYDALSTVFEDEDAANDPFDDLTVPYEASDEDDDGGCFLDIDPDYIDQGFDAECLQDAEDIDFEFVYALHTFVATVEGQANATKGDTMVLLDDSNSYWWLVRVVKDSSIGECLSTVNLLLYLGINGHCAGYLPAEHIETPTERLARLNKHRNIDVGHLVSRKDERMLMNLVVGDHAWGSGREDKESSEIGHEEEESQDGHFCGTYLRGLL